MSLLYSRLSRRFGRRSGADIQVDRRALLKSSLAASAGILISSNPVVSALGTRRSAGKRVVVVGAGFSGLSCAYQLLKAGYDVTVIEARNRVGGRVLSFNKQLSGEFLTGRNIEGGGELIGSNHPTWVGYKEEFGLTFLDVSEDADSDMPLWLDGKLIAPEEAGPLWEEVEAAAARMNDDAAAVDGYQAWNAPKAAEWDRMSVQQWLDRAELSPLVNKGVAAWQAADNGVPADKQSYLGLLAAISGGGGQAYWDESEVYRCAEGNQQLAQCLAEKLGAARVVTKLPVTKIEQRGELVVITCGDGRTLECDDVVLAVPPSVWHKIEMRPALPAVLKPQMGVNVKYLAQVKSRFWYESGRSQYSFTDGPIGWTWDGTDGQAQPEGQTDACLTAFCGAKGAEEVRRWSKEELHAKFRAAYEALYPGFGEQFIQARFMDWPSEGWSQGSYSFPAPGEVTTIGKTLHDGAGKVHFCGEHCSYAFIGYMEGALNSGASLARRLAQRDGAIPREGK